MKPIMTMFFAGCFLLLSSCGDSPEDLTEDMIGIFEDATEIVKEVNDGSDAKDAIEDLEALKPKLKEIAEKMKKIDEESSDEEKEEMEKEMKDKYEKKMTKVMGDLMGEVAKLPTSGTVGAGDVAKAVTDLMGSME